MYILRGKEESMVSVCSFQQLKSQMTVIKLLKPFYSLIHRVYRKHPFIFSL